MTNQANISEEIRALVNRLENSVVVEPSGDVKLDEDVLSKILPEDLSSDTVEKTLNFLGNASEAFEVVVAEKSTRAAAENKDLQETSARLRFSNRMSTQTRWTREVKGATGEAKSYGRTVTKVTLVGSEGHKSNLTALEEFAAASLAPK